LTGIDFVIKHLDGKKLRIKNNPGEVIKPDDIKTVDNKGMPFHKQPYKFGNLFIVFKLVFPESLTTPQLSKISEALTSQAKKKDVDMDATETCNLIEFKEHHKNAHHEGGEGGNGSDEEGEEGGHGHGAGGVRC
jgi:DnaJ family protein A protein 2